MCAGETVAKGLLSLATNGDSKNALRTVFSCLMKQDAEIIAEQLELLVSRVKKNQTGTLCTWFAEFNINVHLEMVQKPISL